MSDPTKTIGEVTALFGSVMNILATYKRARAQWQEANPNGAGELPDEGPLFTLLDLQGKGVVDHADALLAKYGATALPPAGDREVRLSVNGPAIETVRAVLAPADGSGPYPGIPTGSLIQFFIGSNTRRGIEAIVHLSAAGYQDQAVPMRLDVPLNEPIVATMQPTQALRAVAIVGGPSLAGAAVALSYAGIDTARGRVLNADGYALYPDVPDDPALVVHVSAVKDGYLPLERPTAIPAGNFNLRITMERKGAKFSRAQLLDMQGDLMIWCPELRPNFVNGVDPETGIHERADNGATPHGIHAGWVWTTWLPFYPAAKRQIAYKRILDLGFTTVALHVAQFEDGGYHGLRPMSDDDRRDWGTWCNTVHAELLAHHLIPLCAGVSPDAPPADGFNRDQVVLAMNDWDNSPEAGCRVKAVHDAFPNALVFCELPMDALLPKEDACGPAVEAGKGGAWLAAMQRKFPRFVGMLYETDPVNDIEKDVKQLTLLHTFFRDLVENRFEIDTYKKFWENADKATQDRYNDLVQSRCPWLKGFMSGGTTHVAPPDESGGDTTHGTAVGDQIDPASIVWTGGPNIGAFEKTATITRLELRTTGVHVDFTKKNSWPDTPNLEASGGMGPLRYSIGLALKVGDQWAASAPIEFWDGLTENGGQVQAQNVEGSGIGQVAKNWFYDSRWGILQGRQPKAGDQIGFFVCAGDPRNGVFAVKERSNIVLVTLPAEGVPATFTWEA